MTMLTISCRLAGKGYGSALLGTAINQIIPKAITAVWHETEFNAGVRKLFEWYKFEISNPGGKSKCLATLQTTTKVSLPPWISITSEF